MERRMRRTGAGGCSTKKGRMYGLTKSRMGWNQAGGRLGTVRVDDMLDGQGHVGVNDMLDGQGHVGVDDMLDGQGHVGVDDMLVGQGHVGVDDMLDGQGHVGLGSLGSFWNGRPRSYTGCAM